MTDSPKHHDNKPFSRPLSEEGRRRWDEIFGQKVGTFEGVDVYINPAVPEGEIVALKADCFSLKEWHSAVEDASEGRGYYGNGRDDGR